MASQRGRAAPRAIRQALPGRECGSVRTNPSHPRRGSCWRAWQPAEPLLPKMRCRCPSRVGNEAGTLAGAAAKPRAFPPFRGHPEPPPAFEPTAEKRTCGAQNVPSSCRKGAASAPARRGAWQGSAVIRLRGRLRARRRPGRVDVAAVHTASSPRSPTGRRAARDRRAARPRGTARRRLYRDGRQVGFARAVANGVSIVYLADVLRPPRAQWPGARHRARAGDGRARALRRAEVDAARPTRTGSTRGSASAGRARR